MQVTTNQICRSGWSRSANVWGNENVKAHRKWIHQAA